MKRFLLFCLAISAAGCVAPEPPPAVRRPVATAPSPARSTADFEDAPRPNRKLGAPTSDSIIRMAK